MRVTLVHKPGAGDGRHDRAGLEAAFARHGHTVTYAVRDDFEGVLDEPADCVVAAGGDGTVVAVALALLDRPDDPRVPLGILPLGTANNIACRFGLVRPTDALAAGLGGARRAPLDVGVASGPWGEQPVVEGVGFGPFPRAITAALRAPDDALPATAGRRERLRHDLRLLHNRTTDTPARAYTVTLDGETLESRYLLLEVTNTGIVGPNVRLADADPGDGLLDVVLAGDDARRALADYFEARLDGAAARLDLPVRRAREVVVRAPGGRVHLGDDVWPDNDDVPRVEPFEVTMRLGRGRIDVLVPA